MNTLVIFRHKICFYCSTDNVYWPEMHEFLHCEQRRWYNHHPPPWPQPWEQRPPLNKTGSPLACDIPPWSTPSHLLSSASRSSYIAFICNITKYKLHGFISLWRTPYQAPQSATLIALHTWPTLYFQKRSNSLLIKIENIMLFNILLLLVSGA